MIASNYSYGIERDETQLRKNNLDQRKWTNPLEVQCVASSCSMLWHRYSQWVNLQIAQCTNDKVLLRIWPWEGD